MRIPRRGQKSNTALAVFLAISIIVQVGLVGGLDYWWRFEGQFQEGARDYTESFYLYEALSFEAKVDLKAKKKKKKEKEKKKPPPPKKRKIIKKAKKVRKIRKKRKKRRQPPKKVEVKEEPKKEKPKLKAFVVVEMDSGDGDVAVVEAGDTNEDNPVTTGTAPKGKPVQEVAEIDEVTRVPKLTRNISGAALMKHYPRRARLEGVEGTVVLEIMVNEKGRVEKSKVIRLKGVDDKELRKAFRKAARTIVKDLRFRPAAQGDKVVAMWIPWTIQFVLAD